MFWDQARTVETALIIRKHKGNKGSNDAHKMQYHALLSRSTLQILDIIEQETFANTTAKVLCDWLNDA